MFPAPWHYRSLAVARRTRRSRLVTRPLLSFVFLPGLVSLGHPASPPVPCSGLGETLCGDGGAATHARLLRPAGVASDPRGGFLIADTGNDAVRRVSPNGTIATVAGIGSAGYSGDGGMAIGAQLNSPADVSVAADGSVLIADAGNGVIRRISQKGKITTVAGAVSKSRASSPSTSPLKATKVRLVDPEGAAALPGGGFLIADRSLNEVLSVSPAGQLKVVAGTGASGDSGDGGPAVAAMLSSPTRVVPAPGGGFMILDLGNHVVRSVSAAGTIGTVAGSQTAIAPSFGVPSPPGGLAVDAQGDIFVVGGRQVVSVSADGVATVVAGTGGCGSTGDGGSPLAATLAEPSGLARTASGDLLIADINDGGSAVGNVREVGQAGSPIATVAGTAGDSSACVGAGVAPSGALWPIFYMTAPRSARAFRVITISYVTTRAASVRTSLLKNGRRVRTTVQSAAPGRDAATLRPGVRRGTYTMRISASSNVPNNNADQGGTLHLSKQNSARLVVGG
jgi:hypothetical protein